MPTEGSSVAIDGDRARGREFGSGPTVLLLQGIYAGAGGHERDALVPLLAPVVLRGTERIAGAAAKLRVTIALPVTVSSLTGWAAYRHGAAASADSRGAEGQGRLPTRAPVRPSTSRWWRRERWKPVKQPVFGSSGKQCARCGR